MNISFRRALVLLFIVASSFSASERAVAFPRTMNFDIGNSDVFIPDEFLDEYRPVLGSSAGTYWNKIRVEPQPPGNPAIRFIVPPLRDQFGTLVPRAEFLGSGNLGQAILAPADPPFHDGVHLDQTGFFGLTIRTFSPATLIDLVVYFNNPVLGASTPSTIVVNSGLGGGGLGVSTAPSMFFTPSFPGVAGKDYLRFSNLTPIPTTLDFFDTRPGITISVPLLSTANIAAIQIRGEFVPEPHGVALAVFGACLAFARHRKTGA